jgi:hypothetical protein
MMVHDIKTHLTGHTLVQAVDSTPRGHVRLETAFLYPDGSAVDLFVVKQDGPFPTFCLSDLGQTLPTLLDVQATPWLSKRRQGLLEDAIRLYRVEQRGGELIRPIVTLSEVGPGIVALGQACVRVSALIAMSARHELDDLTSA